MHTIDHDHLPSGHTIDHATDEALAELGESFEDHVWDCLHEACHRIADRIQADRDARELWNSDDDRIRESVGNYR